MVAPANEVRIAVQSGADHILQPVPGFKDDSSARIGLVFALIDVRALAKNPEIAVEIRIEDRGWLCHARQFGRTACRSHGTTHGSPAEITRNVIVAAGAALGAGVGN